MPPEKNFEVQLVQGIKNKLEKLTEENQRLKEENARLKEIVAKCDTQQTS